MSLLKTAPKLTAVGLMALTLGACQTASRPPLSRSLPPASQIFATPAKRPAITKGGDARVLALRALNYGDANAARLEQARGTYEAVRVEYAKP